MSNTGTQTNTAGLLVDYYLDSLQAGKLARCDFSDGNRYREVGGVRRRGSGEGRPSEKQDMPSMPFWQVERSAVRSGRLPEKLVDELFAAFGTKRGKKAASNEPARRDGGDPAPGKLARQDESAASAPAGIEPSTSKNADKTDERNEKAGKQGAQQDEYVEIEVVWQTLSEANPEPNSHGLCDAVLSLPACVERDGSLHLVKKGLRAPLMPRALLDESTARGKESGVLLGSYATYRAAAGRAGDSADKLENDCEAGRVWQAYLQLAQQCFDTVVNMGALTRALEGSGLALNTNSELVQVTQARINATIELERLYKSVKWGSEQGKLPLLNDLLVTEPSSRVVPDFDASKAEHMERHCGTMDRDYPLSPSQRRALWCHLDGDVRSTLAVSGPPGTGKTTLLKAVVADAIVRRALRGNDVDAPIIVGTSTNNQAVTNIIDTFANAGADGDAGLCQRWLLDPSTLVDDEPVGHVEDADRGEGVAAAEDANLVVTTSAEGSSSAENTDTADAKDSSAQILRGIGCFFPSSKKRPQAIKDGYLVSGSFSKKGVFADCLNTAYCASAAAYYERMSAAHLGGQDAHASLEFIDGLRQRLVQAVAAHDVAAKEQLRHQLNYAIVPWLGAGELTSDECATLDALDIALDTKVRPLEFWLAIHQFERRWLSEADGIRKEREKAKAVDDRGDISKNRYFSALANLTPLLAMTMYRVPGEFKTWMERAYGHMFSAIDLLIVDEAGQVSTPLGAAVFALAKRAVAMGDGEQIPPVWSFEADEDERRATRLLGLHAGGAHEPGGIPSWELLQEAGLTASEPSSIMRAVQHRCRYETLIPGQEHVMGGLLLTEHYRCQEQIIQVCNDLVYHGLLQPCCTRKVPSGLGLAPLDVLDVCGECKPALTSRVNEREVNRIVSWLGKNYWRVRRLYPAVDPAEVVGVVTPFKQQANAIRKKLRENAQTKGFATKITVGTAHALQGAERRVILFSLVYDEKSPTGFVNDNPNLLNVAVSRAQDSFVVVGNLKVLRKADANSPLGVLAWHLDASGKLVAGSAARYAGSSKKQARGGKGGKSSMSLTEVLRQAREDVGRPAKDRARLRKLKAPEANKKLFELGYLEGQPGKWMVTRSGKEIGMAEEERTGANGKRYCAITYSEAAARRVIEELLG